MVMALAIVLYECTTSAHMGMHGERPQLCALHATPILTRTASP